MYYLISHVVYNNEVAIFGPIHVVAEYLKLKKKLFIQITAPLTFEGAYEFSAGKKKERSLANHSSTLFKYLADLRYICSKLFNRLPTEKDTVIAADPLCALPFVILRLFQDFKFIYYTVDYADRRFDNFLIEVIYRLLDRSALYMADQNWCVSTRIVEVRKNQGYGKKAVFVPNTNISRTRPTTQKNVFKTKLIYVGRMEKNMFVFETIAAYKRILSEKQQLTLTLIGGGNLSAEVTAHIKKNKLEKFVSYLGPLPNKVVQKQLAQHGIGLALYGDSKNWNRYGDSMKIREYQQFGLPVITTDVPSNAEEVERNTAGIVLPYTAVTPQTIAHSIREIQSNYTNYAKQATKLATANLKTKVLDRLLNL